MSNIRSDEEKQEIARQYQDNLPAYEAALKQLERTLKANYGPDRHLIKSGIKSLSSVLEKMDRKPYKSINDMPDIVRATLGVPSDIYDLEELRTEVVKDCVRLFNASSFEEKNDPGSGYSQAFHLNFDIDGITCELIIYFKDFDHAKEEAHKIYERSRTGQEVTPEEAALAREILNKQNATRETKRNEELHRRRRRRENPEENSRGSFRRLLREEHDTQYDLDGNWNKAAKNLLEMSNFFQKKSSEILNLFIKIAENKSEEFNFIVLQKPLAVDVDGSTTNFDKIEQFIKENKGRILKTKPVLIDARQISKHYRQFLDKPFFAPLIKYYVGKHSNVWLVRGNEEALNSMRKNIGSAKVDPNSFRDKLVGEKFKEVKEKYGVVDNGIHVSDSREEGAREADVWFGVPEMKLEYENQDVNDLTETIHKLIWKKLQTIPWANVQYSSTNNETALKSKAVDLDYRVLVPEDKIDETVAKIEELIPGARYDRTGTDDRSGATYKKMEFAFRYGKADIAVVPEAAYKDRVAAGVIVDLLPEEEKRDIGRRKEEAYLLGKKEYEAEKERIRQEIKERYGL